MKIVLLQIKHFRLFNNYKVIKYILRNGQNKYTVMVFNTTFNNISVLLVEETGVPGENHRPATIHKLYHIMLYRVRLTISRIQLQWELSKQNLIWTNFCVQFIQVKLSIISYIGTLLKVWFVHDFVLLQRFN